MPRPATADLVDYILERVGFARLDLPITILAGAQDQLPPPAFAEALAANGWTLEAQTVLAQYRLFSIYSWIAAVSTAAMGSLWQPVEVTRPALISTAAAIEDLDVVGLLNERL